MHINTIPLSSGHLRQSLSDQNMMHNLLQSCLITFLSRSNINMMSFGDAASHFITLLVPIHHSPYHEETDAEREGVSSFVCLFVPIIGARLTDKQKLI